MCLSPHPTPALFLSLPYFIFRVFSSGLLGCRLGSFSRSAPPPLPPRFCSFLLSFLLLSFSFSLSLSLSFSLFLSCLYRGYLMLFRSAIRFLVKSPPARPEKRCRAPMIGTLCVFQVTKPELFEHRRTSSLRKSGVTVTACQHHK